MFVKNVYTFRNLPVEEKERKWTDCCCTIIGAIFALTLFIIACCMFNRGTPLYIQITFTKSTTPPTAKENSATTISKMLPSSILKPTLTPQSNGIAWPSALLRERQFNAPTTAVLDW